MNYFIGENGICSINDDFDSIKIFTIDLLIGMVSVINRYGLVLHVYKNQIKDGYIIEYMNMYVKFKTVKECCLFLKDYYFKCKVKAENDFYKSHLQKILNERELD